MATPRLIIVDPDSGTGFNYTSLSAAEAAEQGDISVGTGTDEIVTFECRSDAGTADTTDVVFSGWTTSSTNTVTVEAGSSDQHNGVFNTGIYRLKTTGINACNIGISWMRFINLQIETTQSGFFSNSPFTQQSIHIEGCYIRSVSSSVGGGIRYVGASGPLVMINNIITGFDGTGGRGIQDTSSFGRNGITPRLSNNTVDVCDLGIVGDAQSVIQNNIVTNCTTSCYSGSSGTGTSNNIASDTTAPGGDSHDSETSANLFTDASTGDYTLKTGTNAVGGGATLSSVFTTDITGATRTVPWDIGAFLFAAGGPVTIVIANAVFSFAGQALKANEDITIGVDALTWSGQDMKVNETITPATKAIDWAGQAVKASKTLTVDKTDITWTGQDIKVNETITIGSKFINWSGKAVTIAGEVIKEVRGLMRLGLKLGLKLKLKLGLRL